jgi:hypothetical protein
MARRISLELLVYDCADVVGKIEKRPRRWRGDDVRHDDVVSRDCWLEELFGGRGYVLFSKVKSAFWSDFSQLGPSD